MKNGKMYLAVAATWILLLLLDSVSGVLRACFFKKAARPVGWIFRVLNLIRGVVLFSLAALNFALIAAGVKKNEKKVY